MTTDIPSDWIVHDEVRMHDPVFSTDCVRCLRKEVEDLRTELGELRDRTSRAMEDWETWPRDDGPTERQEVEGLTVVLTPAQVQWLRAAVGAGRVLRLLGDAGLNQTADLLIDLAKQIDPIFTGITTGVSTPYPPRRNDDV